LGGEAIVPSFRQPPEFVAAREGTPAFIMKMSRWNAKSRENCAAEIFNAPGGARTDAVFRRRARGFFVGVLPNATRSL
jgi:hypothetical protein